LSVIHTRLSTFAHAVRHSETGLMDTIGNSEPGKLHI